MLFCQTHGRCRRARGRERCTVPGSAGMCGVRQAGGEGPRRESRASGGVPWGGSVTMRDAGAKGRRNPHLLFLFPHLYSRPQRKIHHPCSPTLSDTVASPPPPLPTTTDARQVFAPLLAPLVNLWLWENTRPADIFLTLLARAFSTIPARVPRTNVVGALALGTAVAGYALYECTSSMSRWRCSRLKRVMAVPSYQVPCPA